jgi:hypothetical protein
MHCSMPPIRSVHDDGHLIGRLRGIAHRHRRQWRATTRDRPT